MRNCHSTRSQPGDALGHRVLHLQTGVHLQEIVLQLRIDDELHRAGAAVAHRQRRGHRVAAHRLAHRGADDRGGRFLDDLLSPALRAAIALAQMNGVAVRVGKHLHLDVPAAFDQPLEHQPVVAEGALRFAPRAGQRLGQLVEVAYQTHAAATAAGHRLDQQREAAPARPSGQRGVVLLSRPGSRARRARRLRACRRLARALSPIGGDRRRRRADEHQAGVGAGLREVGALAQEAVAGVHRVGAAARAPLDQCVDLQVGQRGGRLSRCAPPRRPAAHAVRRRRHRCTPPPCGSRARARCASRGRRSPPGWRPGSSRRS